MGRVLVEAMAAGKPVVASNTGGIPDLVKLARTRGFSVVFINDHDRMAMEYGLPPFRNILKKRVELNSINKAGAPGYLNNIRAVAEKYPEMIIIPGSETAAFYYWTGSYLKKNLTAHNHERRILTIGLDKANDYQDLPIIHNGLSIRFSAPLLPGVLMFFAALVFCVFLSRHNGIYRIFGSIIAVLSVLFMINTNLFRSSPFDQYHGDQGIVPYQGVIDHVNSRGGMTFWNYPETRSGVRRKGPIFVNTPPHPEVLGQSKGYTGFAALYGDIVTITEPGDTWDAVLLEYCRGTREQPVWGISTADFHEDGGAGEKLGNFPTVFLARKKTAGEILSAMRTGRMYACRGNYPQRMMLNEFSVCSSGKVVSGEEILLRGHPRVHISLSLKEPTQNRVKIRLIRSGKLIKTFNGSLPIKIDYEDKYFEPGQKIYYRIDARGHGALVSNPIFVTFEHRT
jgi:hypothetical protein